jgi:hypothetical protein
MDEQTKSKKKYRRHLDHLQDITSGRHWTPLPEPLRSLWFDGRISDVKAKLIMVMLSHASDFHIRNDYLRNRFSPVSLKKYLPELIQDGIIRREKVRDGSSTITIFHTNPIDDWKLREDAPDFTRSSVNGSRMNGSRMNGSRMNALNKKKGNQTKSNKTNPNHCRGNGHNDQEEQQRPKEGGNDPSDKATLIALRQSIEWLFSKSKQGGYTFDVVEEVFREVIDTHGYSRCQKLTEWLCENMNRYPEVHAGSWLVNKPALRKAFAAVEALVELDQEAQANGMTLVEWREFQRDREEREKWSGCDDHGGLRSSGSPSLDITPF